MALNPLRIRHALRLATSLLRHPLHTPTPIPSHPIAVSARHFHRTPPVSFSSSPKSFDMDKIDPDTILFEGCDYKHWLIVMDFGKDPNQRPPSDQMVDTYVQTAAQVLGSVEEAKKRIYACSCTTYTGFQVLVDEEVSKKFEGLPGVLFVLPDSYIDPVNKEYGGDKYNNGEIIPRPPPVQYSRTRRPVGQNEQRPRLPTPNQQGNPTYNQQGNPPYNQQGNPAYNQRAPALGDGRGYAPTGPQQGFQQQQGIPPQQNYPPRQNYGPPSAAPPHMGNSVPPGPQQGFQQQRAIPPQQNYPGVGRDGYQSGSNFVPSQQGNHGYNQPQGQINNRPGNAGGYVPPPGNAGGYVPPPGNAGGYAPPPGNAGGYAPPPGNFGHNHPQGQGGYAPPGPIGYSGDTRVNPTSPGIGGYEQRRPGSFEQRGAGQYGEARTGSPPQGGNQRFPPTSNEQSDPMQQRNYPPATPGFNQGRY